MFVNKVQIKESINFLKDLVKSQKQEKKKVYAELDEHVGSILKPFEDELNALANKNKTDIRLYSSKDLFMVNSGARTSVYDLSKMEHPFELMDCVRDNLFENNRIRHLK